MDATVFTIILMLIFSGFFSGMEIAFVSSSRLKHELDIKRNLLPASILSIFYKNPSRFIGALLLGNNIALVVYGIAMAKLLEPLIYNMLTETYASEFLILLIQTILSTIIILITAEFLPKILFRINPNRILSIFSLPVWIFYFVFYPLIYLYIGIAELLLKYVFRVKLSPEPYIFTALDLDEYVTNFKPVGDKDDEDAQEVSTNIQMIQNAIDFKNLKLRECMVPRTDIQAIEINDEIKKLVNILTETGHSKIMVYKESIDNIVGYVHAKDIFTKPKSVQEIVRPVDVFPETMAANELLNYLIKQKKSIVVVLDEFGGTSGIVTIEDIIEEIFGEIEDEFDVDETNEKVISETEFVFSSRLEIDYLNDKYELEIPVSEEYETLGGFIIQHHEEIPQAGEEIEILDFRFTILEASDKLIEEVKLELLNHS
ncbi:MAG: hemolysin [Marinilabiliales bacterium]|nr:MAG: hemolysin [Marinilabiliales bacterium]